MKFNWLHISDVHLEPIDDYGRDIVLRTLVSTVQQHRDRGRTFDAIFVTGDIVSHGKSDAYANATKLFDDLCSVAGLDRRRVFVVPGNHDVDRRRGSFLARTLASSEESDHYFAAGQPKYHFDRLVHFRTWYDHYFAGIRSFPTDSTCGPVEVLDVVDGRVGVLPINTSLFCADDSDHENLWIGRRCIDGALDALQVANVDLSVALLHHPLSFLHSGERSGIRDRLQRTVDMVLRGHLHETDIQSVVNSSGAALHLAAGSAYVRAQHPKLALLGRIVDDTAFVLPLRYYGEVETWHNDPTVFPDAERYEGRLALPKRDGTSRSARPSSTQPSSTQPNQPAGKAPSVSEPAAGSRYSKDELGKWTVAAARRDERAIELLCEVTGLSAHDVNRSLSGADGRTRLRSLFQERWFGDVGLDSQGVSEDEEHDAGGSEHQGVDHEGGAGEASRYSADELANWTVAAARRDDEVIEGLTDITNLSRRWVRRHLKDADGRMRLRTLFEDRWPNAEDDAQTSVPAHELASWTVAATRDDQVAIDSLVAITGQSRTWITRKLIESDGRRRLRRLFAEHWPSGVGESQGAEEEVELYDAEAIADWTVAAARGDQTAIDSLVTITGISRLRVQRNLRDADGRIRVRTLFASSWPTPEDDETELYTADELADRTVASARGDDDVIESLTEITGIHRRWVKRYLNGADGRTRLRTLFSDRWPLTEGDQVFVGGTDELGNCTVASVRDSASAVDLIAEWTCLSVEVVGRRLQEADGRMRVRSVFDNDWADAVDSQDVETLAQRTVASVRGDEGAIDMIGRVTDIRPRAVRRRLARVDGRNRIATVFADYWPD